MILGILVVVLPSTFTLSCPLELEIGESRDNEYIHDAMATACVFAGRSQTTPLLEQH